MNTIAPDDIKRIAFHKALFLFQRFPTRTLTTFRQPHVCRKVLNALRRRQHCVYEQTQGYSYFIEPRLLGRCGFCKEVLNYGFGRLGMDMHVRIAPVLRRGAIAYCIRITRITRIHPCRHNCHGWPSAGKKSLQLINTPSHSPDDGQASP